MQVILDYLSLMIEVPLLGVINLVFLIVALKSLFKSESATEAKKRALIDQLYDDTFGED